MVTRSPREYIRRKRLVLDGFESVDATVRYQKSALITHRRTTEGMAKWLPLVSSFHASSPPSPAVSTAT